MGMASEDVKVTEVRITKTPKLIVLLQIIPEPPKQQISALQKIFVDIAGVGGEIGWPELKQLLDHSMRDVIESGSTFSKDMCRSMVAMMDADGSGKLGYPEFEVLLNDIAKWKVIIYCTHCIYINCICDIYTPYYYLQAVFKYYDRKQSRRLNAFELREALNSCGYRLNNKVLNVLAHRYGCLDGEVAFDDFIMCCIKTKTMINRFKEKERRTGTATFNLDDWLEQTIYS